MTSDEASYDRLKKHGGRGYSGMPVGRAHKWNYDQGEWRERKFSPDEWEIFYQTTKRRAAKAPEESGAPVGTEYNWLIVTHQRVEKCDANSYLTRMEGKKFKVAHKRAEKGQWSASEKAQRRQVIRYLEQMIEELKQADASEPLPYSVGEHEHVYGLSLRTKAELSEMAKELGVSGISKLKREELLQEVKARLRPASDAEQTSSEQRSQNQSEAKSEAQAAKPLQQKTRQDLYRMASERQISGRSEMNKAQLMAALRRDMQGDSHRRSMR